MVNLTDLYFVQNRISKIEGLEGLTKLRNLELGANRIRVGVFQADLKKDWAECSRKSRILTL